MKKLLLFVTATVLTLCFAMGSAFAVVPTDDGYTTILDWSTLTDADLNGGPAVSSFADLSFYGVPSSGIQSISDGNFSIDVTPGSGDNCYQFSLGCDTANGELWAKSSALRFYTENNTESDDLSLTLYLWIASDSIGYNRPFTCGSDVYMYDENGNFVEPDFRLDSSFGGRYVYIPAGFKGWVVIPSTTVEDSTDVYAGWLPSYWSISENIDMTLADFNNVSGLGFDIRADGVYEGNIVIGNLELLGDEFDKPNDCEVIKPVSTPTADPTVSATDAPDDGTTVEPSATSTQNTENNGLSTGAIAGIIAGVAVVAAAVIIVLTVKKKKA